MTYESNQLAKYNGYLATITDREPNHELIHYGIKGQKHGIRRFQYEDGTLTEEGKRRYGVTDTGTGGNKKLEKKYQKDISKLRKLDDKANVNLQKQKAQEHFSRAKKIAGASVGAIVGSHGLKIGSDMLSDKYRMDANRHRKDQRSSVNMREHMDDTLNKALGLGGWSTSGVYKLKDMRDKYGAMAENSAKKAIKAEQTSDFFRQAGRTLSTIKDLAATAGLGASLAEAGQGLAAKRRISEKGHAKAVAKRKAQYSRMQKMYANTKYSDILKTDNEKIKRNRNA